jgi:outer membrane biosynthesis protein TonB
LKKQNKNKTTAVYVTLGLHAALLLLFFFMMAWTEPDPPIPEYGIEFSLGNSIVSENQYEEPVIQPKVDEVEEVSEQEVEPEPAEAANTVAAEETETDDAETIDALETSTTTQDMNSPDVVEEKVSEKEKTTKKVDEEDIGEDENTNSSTEESEEEIEKETPKIAPKINDQAIMKSSDAGSGAGNEGQSLDMAGWDWDSKPEPNDNTTENGLIVFQITIDDEGEIIEIKTLNKTVSPVVENIYKSAVMDLTFSKTMDNRTAATTSTGKITFIIQSK